MLIILPKILLDIFLLIDILVFNVYRFHIDMLFIEMLIFDFEGIGISWGMGLLAIAFIAIGILLQVYFFIKARQLTNMKTMHVNIGIIALFILGQGVHIWGNFTKQESILVYTPYMPYYAPITSTGKMASLQNHFPDLVVVNSSRNNPIITHQDPSQRPRSFTALQLSN